MITLKMFLEYLVSELKDCIIKLEGKQKDTSASGFVAVQGGLQ